MNVNVNKPPLDQGIFDNVTGGSIEVAYYPCDAPEFPPNWTKKLIFIEAPSIICVRWTHTRPVASANWEIQMYSNANWHQAPGTSAGNVPTALLNSQQGVFQIPLATVLPQDNTTPTDLQYEIKLKCKDAKGSELFVSHALLIHQPKPAPKSAFDCTASSSNRARRVVVEIPKMTVNHTTTTSGDGDRDELYFLISNIGPGEQSSQKRLPSLDDYYEAKNSYTVTPNGWTNKDQHAVRNPVFWSGTINEGESVLLSVTAMEQDNADLKNIKDGIVQAMSAVAAIASSTGTPQGQIVAAVAGAVAGASQLLIPNTSGHDFVGFLLIKLTNKCGYIQTAFVTYKSQHTAAGTVSNQFLDTQTLQGVQDRLVALDINPPAFGPELDWSPYLHILNSDEFWWVASGTSSAKYTFLLKASALPVI